MSRIDIIRAWKDEDYRLSLSDAERSLVPANPAGLRELDETVLDSVAGAGGSGGTHRRTGSHHRTTHRHSCH